MILLFVTDCIFYVILVALR